MILQQQIINEINQIPNNKLEELYDFIHYFRVGLEKETGNKSIQKRSIGLYKDKFEVPKSFFEPLSTEVIDSFEGN